jgi:hypothetical protein
VNIGEWTIEISLKNDAGITPEMVQALKARLDDAGPVWCEDEDERLAREAIRRLWVVTTGGVPDETDI